MVKRIDKLTNAQRAQMQGWAERWIEICLCTEPADRSKFEAAERCYRAAGLPWHGNVIWVQQTRGIASFLRCTFATSSLYGT